MSVMYIEGGVPLEGAWRVQGAKNSVLPILAGCLLTKEPVTISNCPRLSDVDAAVDILHHLGATCVWEGETLVVDAAGANHTCIDQGRMRAMRSSIMFLGGAYRRGKELGQFDQPGIGALIGTFPSGNATNHRYDLVIDRGVNAVFSGQTGDCTVDVFDLAG